MALFEYSNIVSDVRPMTLCRGEPVEIVYKRSHVIALVFTVKALRHQLILFRHQTCPHYLLSDAVLSKRLTNVIFIKQFEVLDLVCELVLPYDI